MARRGPRRSGAAAVCCLLVLAAAGRAAAQSQGAALEKLRAALQPDGWQNVDPSADACASPGTVTPGVMCSGSAITQLNLGGKNLQGSIPNDPSLWADLPGLTGIDLSGNPKLVGSVPEALSSAIALKSINVANSGVAGDVPSSLSGKVSGVGGAGSGSPGSMDGSSNATNSTSTSGQSGQQQQDAQKDQQQQGAQGSEQQQPEKQQQEQQQEQVQASSKEGDASKAASEPPAAGAQPSKTKISDAPICACALQGVSSGDCLAALDTRCAADAGPSGAEKEACDSVSKATISTDAAATLASFLAGECFVGQGMDVSPCVCFQDPNSNDCAKARLSQCTKKAKLCVPLQINTEPLVVAAFARENCPVAPPRQSGVQVNVTFTQLTLGQWTAQLTQSIGNAIAATGNVSAADVRLADVRPFVTPSAGRRRLLQTANGVQAVYFAVSPDPDDVNTRLQLAASDGSLAKALAAYGVPSSSQPSVALKSFYGPPPSATTFPLWLLAPILVGVVALVALTVLACVLIRRCRRGGGAEPRHAEFAPAPLGSFGEKVPLPAAAAAAAAPAAAPAAGSDKDYHSQRPYEAHASPATVPASPAPLPSPARSGGGAPAAAAAAAAAPVVSHSVRLTSNGGTSGGGGGGMDASFQPPAPIRTSSRDLNASPPPLPPPPATAAAAGPSGAPPAQWRTNVRPAGPVGGGGVAAGGVNSMTSANRGQQQAERAKFWAQFQETWQQVRETKRLKEDGEPGTPSSGTAWTETTVGRHH
ncbi:hypothetical protein Rsub_09498 [Raphidocelis subcapitata]|uniref:Leucine-rich repeat-containing N-terminal plant-type domain-containing protein n=1 Tax=Raphidocelis subcapitata TaxID=307507 RepID=A0A2V0PJ00_9CHLO|nr:hypothetical protein Rsub_09498 [Raphidocelis subcapitata]|eukprot:GBF97025.1 hypothetical protein Rsub_09498 [Raphidocelis subcapitata]